jgi:hypothetical protein
LQLHHLKLDTKTLSMAIQLPPLGLQAFREIASSKEFQRTLGNIHKQGLDMAGVLGGFLD